MSGGGWVRGIVKAFLDYFLASASYAFFLFLLLFPGPSIGLEHGIRDGVQTEPGILLSFAPDSLYLADL